MNEEEPTFSELLGQAIKRALKSPNMNCTPESQLAAIGLVEIGVLNGPAEGTNVEVDALRAILGAVAAVGNWEEAAHCPDFTEYYHPGELETAVASMISQALAALGDSYTDALEDTL